MRLVINMRLQTYAVESSLGIRQRFVNTPRKPSVISASESSWYHWDQRKPGSLKSNVKFRLITFFDVLGIVNITKCLTINQQNSLGILGLMLHIDVLEEMRVMAGTFKWKLYKLLFGFKTNCLRHQSRYFSNT